MKYFSTLLSLFLGFVPMCSIAQNNSVIKKIEQLEYDWHNAWVTHDITLIENVLADDFLNVGRTGGRLNKQQTLENFKQDSSIYEYCTPYDLEYRVYKNTVIVMCRSKEKGISNGKPFNAVYFSVDTFIKRKNKWQCVQASVSLIPATSNG